MTYIMNDWIRERNYCYRVLTKLHIYNICIIWRRFELYALTMVGKQEVHDSNG
jgi:hypothetical protein